MTYDAWIRIRLLESLDVKRRLLESVDVMQALDRIATALVEAYRNGRKMLVFGNGGSAADAQHIVAELVGGFTIKNRPALPALALTVNTSALTAIGNDYDFESVFERQVSAHGQPGDVAIGISTSGNARNVASGLAVAKKMGLVTVAITGRIGGRIGDIAHHCVRVPSDETARIQETHIAIGHILCELVEVELFGGGAVLPPGVAPAP